MHVGHLVHLHKLSIHVYNRLTGLLDSLRSPDVLDKGEDNTQEGAQPASVVFSFATKHQCAHLAYSLKRSPFVRSNSPCCDVTRSTKAHEISNRLAIQDVLSVVALLPIRIGLGR